MRLGKLSSEELLQICLSKTSLKNKEIVQSAGLAEDCSALKTNKTVLLTTDPITATGNNAGKLAIYVSANDVAVCGGTPFACLLTVIAPANGSVENIANFMSEAYSTAEEMNIDIIGGHTEFSDAVNKLVVVCTMVGSTKKLIKTCGAKVGDSIIMTKSAGIEATAIMAKDHREKLLAGGMTKAELDEAEGFLNKIPVLIESSVAAKHVVNSMHDITEGGVYGAVAELAESAGLGATIYADRIPVAPITAKMCRILNVSPMRIISSGSILIVSPEPEKIISALNKKNISATVIGTIRQKKEITAIGEGTVEKLLVQPDQLLSIK